MTTIEVEKMQQVQYAMSQHYWHFGIYKTVVYLYTRLKWIMVVMWMLAFILTIYMVSTNQEHGTLSKYVSIYWIAWIAIFFLAGFDKMLINQKLRKCYVCAFDCCKTYLHEDLTEDEFRTYIHRLGYDYYRIDKNINNESDETN